MSMKLPLCNLSFKSFTLIELLIVIVIIGILAVSLLPRITGIQAKARDTKRITDMRQIEVALNLYHDIYGSLPLTSSYETESSRDYSYTGVFMTFLETSNVMTSVPLDPINDRSRSKGYRYYCYSLGTNVFFGDPIYTGAVAVIAAQFERKPSKQILEDKSVYKSSTFYKMLPVHDCVDWYAGSKP